MAFINVGGEKISDGNTDYHYNMLTREQYDFVRKGENMNTTIFFENGSIKQCDLEKLLKGRYWQETYLGGLMKNKQTKIQQKLELINNEVSKKHNYLHELEVANKHADVSDKILKVKSDINCLEKLYAGYDILDDMDIANVIVNNNHVIVEHYDGSKAVSKPDENDEFNFLAGFFMNLVKLGSKIYIDGYDYKCHVALTDIENGGL